jgi:superfamily I DNA/RNA helicase
MFSLPLKGGKDSLADWKSGRCIWASTIKTFKGLEADCIIVTDVSLGDFSKSSQSELYVGTTRARHQLIILPIKTADQIILQSFNQNESL